MCSGRTAARTRSPPASPGGLLGFTDLFSKAVTDEVASATDFAGLAVDKDITIDGGRAGHLTTSVSDVDGGKKLDITVTVDKTITGQDLRLSSQTPKVELSVADGITANLKARLALSVVWTGASTDKIYVVRTDSTPRLDLDARASIDNVTAKAAIGILGVTLTGSNIDIDAHLVGTVSDPDGDGKLFFTQNAPGDGELASRARSSVCSASGSIPKAPNPSKISRITPRPSLPRHPRPLRRPGVLFGLRVEGNECLIRCAVRTE